jgi:hypothetical protein
VQRIFRKQVGLSRIHLEDVDVAQLAQCGQPEMALAIKFEITGGARGSICARIAAARSQFTTLYSFPEVGAEWAQATVITNARPSSGFIASAKLMMWCPPVLEFPGAPKLSVTPLPPKLSSRNSVPSAFH